MPKTVPAHKKLQENELKVLERKVMVVEHMIKMMTEQLEKAKEEEETFKKQHGLIVQKIEELSNSKGVNDRKGKEFGSFSKSKLDVEVNAATDQEVEKENGEGSPKQILNIDEEEEIEEDKIWDDLYGMLEEDDEEVAGYDMEGFDKTDNVN